MKQFSETLRNRMVQRMTGSRAMTATALSEEVGSASRPSPDA